ncbi:MAG: carbon monoxide dehydrogenase, partial [Rhodospirillaceae bacterium]|nr:carbon monoxide dehydrogenase [Rhodospirillaceae bacterium]
MKPAPFEYCRADTLDEALDLMAEFGSDAAVLAGGMSLGPLLNMRLARPAAIVDVNPVEELSGIRLLDESVETGALCRQADALDSALVREEVPLLARALPFVGHFQTRNRGTLGGSVCHADPSAEIPLALAALGGDVVLRQKGEMRAVAANDFFEGIFTTVREPDELVTALRWPRSNPKTGYAFDEIAQRHGDFAIGAAAAVATVAPDGNLAALSLGLGGIEDRPVLADLAGFVGAPVTARTASE